MKKLACIFVLSIATFMTYAQQSIRVYNYTEFIDPEIITSFERETGIKVEYRVYTGDTEVNALFDSNAVADVVIPSHFMLPSLIADKKIRKLDRDKLPNYANIDPNFLLKMQQVDAKNEYAMPYLWLITGLAINKELVEKQLGSDYSESWSLLFDEEQLHQLSECGVAITDSPNEFYAALLDHQGYDLSQASVARIKNTEELLTNIKHNIKKVYDPDAAFDYINALETNKLCLGLASSGDVATNAKEHVKLIIPDNHALLTITTMVIPQTAQNISGAHAFINYMMRPNVAAKLVSATGYGATIKDIQNLLPENLRANNLLFPDNQTIRSFSLIKGLDHKKQKALEQVWTNVM